MSSLGVPPPARARTAVTLQQLVPVVGTALGLTALHLLAARVLLVLVVLPVAATAAVWCARCWRRASARSGWRAAAAGGAVVCGALAVLAASPLGVL